MLYARDKLILRRLGGYAAEGLHCEQLLCSVQYLHGSRISFGVVYRSPDNEDLSWMSVWEQYCKHPRVCVMGDFNCPNVRWQEWNCAPAALEAERRILQLAIKLQLQQKPFAKCTSGTSC